MAVRCLKFLVTKLNRSYFSTHCHVVYGIILRALSYKYDLIGTLGRHSEELTLYIFKILRILRNLNILPGLLSQNYFVYLIYVLNREEEGSKIHEAASEYARELVFESKSEFYFLKTWKKKVLGDRYYKEAKLLGFIKKVGDKEAVCRLFVDKIE